MVGQGGGREGGGGGGRERWQGHTVNIENDALAIEGRDAVGLALEELIDLDADVLGLSRAESGHHVEDSGLLGGDDKVELLDHRLQ